MAFREVLLTVIKPRGCGRLACLTIRFVLVTTLLSIGVLLGGNYLTATVSNDRRLSYANVLPSRGSGNENNVISLSAVSYRNNEDFVKQQQFIK